MQSRINHLTVLSENHFALGRFYEGFFHMRPAGTHCPTGDVHIGDGNMGLNIRPRLPGLPWQYNHFGLEVDDVEATVARIREHWPAIEWLERSDESASGSVSTHDPAGNVIGLFQSRQAHGRDFYEAQGGAHDRRIDHFGLRVLHPEKVAEFYMDVFGLAPVKGPDSTQKNAYLSDGRVTMVIIPWQINDFLGTGITARGIDHVGFKVESLAALKSDIDRITTKNYRFQRRTSVLGRGKEGSVRLSMFRRTCPIGCHHMADSDGFLIDVVE